MSRAPLILAILALATQPAWPQLLAPGKPAGTKAAQHISYRTGFIGVSLIAIAVTFAVPGASTSTATSTATTS
ncbi:MAG TPA: hypothetical protein VGH23_11030 [Rhizomicrobium sp.]|jgi:hypothetical protein